MSANTIRLHPHQILIYKTRTRIKTRIKIKNWQGYKTKINCVEHMLQGQFKNSDNLVSFLKGVNDGDNLTCLARKFQSRLAL